MKFKLVGAVALAALGLLAAGCAGPSDDGAPVEYFGVEEDAPTTQDFGSDIDEDADPGVDASLRDRCAAVMPGATSQEISDCVLTYTLMQDK